MKHLIGLVLMLTSSAASALTCVRPDPARSFATAQAAPETYIILRGHIGIAEVLIPPEPADPQAPAPIPVWFTGTSLTPQGFTQPYEGPMVVQPTCAGPWCGEINQDMDLIAFARQENGSTIITADPCGGWILPDDAATVATLTACIRGEACQPGPQSH